MFIPFHTKRAKNWAASQNEKKAAPKKEEKKLNRVVPLHWIPKNYQDLLKTFSSK